MKVYCYSIRTFRATYNGSDPLSHKDDEFTVSMDSVAALAFRINLLQRLGGTMATVCYVANDQHVLQTEHE